MTIHRSLTCGFSAGTLVRTPRGLFPIERITAGDDVLSSDGCISLVIAVHQASARDLVLVSCSDGATVLTTPWHRFFDLHGDLCFADRLRTGTRLRRNGGLVEIKRVDRVTREQSVHNLALERGVSFFANGLLVEAPHEPRVLRPRSLIARGAA